MWGGQCSPDHQVRVAASVEYVSKVNMFLNLEFALQKL